ncbi:MAG: FAD-binding monooxygenase, partial [Rubrobacteraceae bacterium]
GHLQRAATRDEEVCRALVFVTGLLAPPETLFRAKIAHRVLRSMLARHRKPAATLVPETPAPEAV